MALFLYLVPESPKGVGAMRRLGCVLLLLWMVVSAAPLVGAEEGGGDEATPTVREEGM